MKLFLYYFSLCFFFFNNNGFPFIFTKREMCKIDCLYFPD